ncbi:MAG TPA: hypothetical protein VFI84_04135 [Candidatus Saccharimonadales bacterium]|nr:hypothetical protein [Candidatus Saccharimonadales bacterium]
MKRIILSTIVAMLAVMPVSFALVPAYADSKTEVCNGIGVAGGNCNDSTGATSGIGNLVSSVVEILSIVVGIAAIIMIIIAGLKFVTAGGDSNSVSSAKNTLMYALIGLVVAALAQFLVHFVLNKLG